MRLQSKNLKKVMVINLCYIELILQVLFRIWLCITALHCAGNNICDRVYLIQSGINLKYIPTEWCDLISNTKIKDNRKMNMSQIKTISASKEAPVYYDSDDSIRVPRKNKSMDGVIWSLKQHRKLPPDITPCRATACCAKRKEFLGANGNPIALKIASSIYPTKHTPGKD